MVIRKIIGYAKTSYVEGRNILDGPLIVNEIFSWSKRIKRKTLLFKFDFGKAFDSVNWDYLDSILLQMNSGHKWKTWIKG